jgi:hypothetical protein
MGRASNVAWPSMFIVTAVSILCLMLVWFIRSILRYIDNTHTPDDEVWGLDWFDVLAGVGLFIFVVVAGVVIACRGHQKVILISSNPTVLSSPQPTHTTPVQSYQTSNVFTTSHDPVYLTPPALQKTMLPYAVDPFAPIPLTVNNPPLSTQQ